MEDARLEQFNEHRPLLFGIAWRMLGNVADAEDMVQEAFLRWQKTTGPVRSSKAFLITIVTRVCLNHLDRAHVKREQGGDMEQLLAESPGAETNPADDPDLADALDAAFTVVLQCLSPVERAVFLLREVFDRDYSEVARILEKSEENCRQILRRARERVAGKKSRFEVTLEQQENVLREFLSATESGELERLARLLASDATLVRDSANLGMMAPPPVRGVAAVAAHFASRAGELFPWARTIRKSSFQKMPLLLTYHEGCLKSALVFVLQGGLVQKFFLITCPVRLRCLASQCLPGTQ